MNLKKLFQKDSIAYNRGDKFFTYNDDQKIYFTDIKEISKKVTVNTQYNAYLTRELIVELSFENGGLLLKAETSNIEQYKQLSELADDIEHYKKIPPKGIVSSTKSTTIKDYYLGFLFLPFAFNGMSEMFFHNSILQEYSFVSVVSLLSAILLTFWIVTAPMYWFANKVSMNKLQSEDDFIQGRESSVRDIDFTNFFVAILIFILIYLIYVKW